MGPSGSGAPPELLPRRDILRDHYVAGWAPSGVFFIRFRYALIYGNSDYEAAVASTDGRTRRSIVGNASTEECLDDLSVSPSGTQIAFSYAEPDEQGGELCAIYVADADGSSVRRIDYGKAPMWSPDGTAVAYDQGFAGGTRYVAVVEMPSGAIRVLSLGRGAHWSPDGRQLVFTRGSARTTAVFAVSRDGSGLRQLTARDGMQAWGWSPDGRQVLFERRRSPSGPSVWVMDADGSRKRRLAAGHSADWSPRGDWVAFARGPLTRYATATSLHVVRPTGGRARALGSVRPIYGTENARPRYAWAPDGRRLAVSRLNGCRDVGIYIVHLRGQARSLTNDCRIRGTPRSDVLRGTESRDFIWGFASADRMFGAGGRDDLFGGMGSDVVFGGGNHDRLDGGPGRDRLLGGGGADIVLARDGEADQVACGSHPGGRDRAVVDRLDRVSSDCEDVSRR